MTDTLSEGLFDSASEEEVTDLFDTGEKAPESPFKEDAKPPPNRHAARTSGENLIGGLVIGAGSILVNRNIDPPVGRCLQLEAPLAGKKIDEVIANTWIDKLLQPLFRKSDDLEGLGAVLGLPILVAIIERKPEMGPMLFGPLEEVLGATLEQVAPLMRQKKTKQRRAARSMTEINDAFEIPRGEDPVQYLLKNWLFQEQFHGSGMNGATEE